MIVVSCEKEHWKKPRLLRHFPTVNTLVRQLNRIKLTGWLFFSQDKAHHLDNLLLGARVHGGSTILAMTTT